MTRRAPDALLPAPAARLIGFALLGALGVAQWARMIDGLGLGRALVWVALGAAVAGAIWACDRLGRRRRAAAGRAGVVALGLLAAVPAAGLDPGLLRPRRWGELADGLAGGADALATVRLPYAGTDPWPGDVLVLLGAVLCVTAAALALWPREGGRGYPFLALAVLLVLAATPAVSLGGARPILFGFALAALTVCFLWLERLPLRPGFGVAALLGIALAGALPLAGAADREAPWFDYRTFAEGLGPERTVRFDWSHVYGPITWSRERREVLRVKATRGGAPEYWKATNLDDFDGGGWSERGLESAPGLETTDPPSLRSRPEWTREFEVSVRQVRSTDIVGPGAILSVEDPSRRARRSAEPGRWVTASDLRRGDSYTVRSYTPRPSRTELAAASSGVAGQRSDDLVARIPFRQDVPARLRPSPRADAAIVRFPAFGERGAPRAEYPELGLRGSGDLALRRSVYARTWRLAQRLREEARTPYEYVVAVDRYLHQRGFVYSERPVAPAPDMAVLEAFLFDTRDGYCQQYSGAMALLLRMGGIPARVAAGFSPGGFSRGRGEWIVRDTDAHSWVEAWFDAYGWVTFDPTPGRSPARSQVAALSDAARAEAGGGALPGPDGASTTQPGEGNLRRDLLEDSSGRGDGAGVTAGAEAGGGGGGPALALLLGLGLGGLALAGLAATAVARRRLVVRGATPLERAVLELEAAFRRSGRPTPPGTTLAQLEGRLRGSTEAVAYVRGLRRARYGAGGEGPTTAGRRAVRRELADGLGWSGRLRALWAMPPRRSR